MKNKFIFWTPRIFGIIFILFLMLFSFDVFGEGLTCWQTVGAFLLHNVPTIILGIIIAIAWKYELVGAITFALAGIAYIVSLFFSPFEWFKIIWAIQIAGPAIFISYLFFRGWQQKKSNTIK